MPKYGIHSIVIKEATEKLCANTDVQARQVGGLLKKEENRVYAMLGAIGPDLFFYTPDYPIMPPYIMFLKAEEKINEIYETILGPLQDLKDKLEEKIEELVASVPCDFVQEIVKYREQVEKASELKKDLLKESFKALATAALFDTDLPHSKLVRRIFQRSFEPELQENYEEFDWFWFDQLHYRLTGEFASNLVNIAHERNDDQLRAYAYAYLSHIATDTVGHPFVNQICGGPYRMSVQRHATAENFMDVWEYHEKYTKDIGQTLYYDLGLDAYPEMPKKLSKLLEEALNRTYKNDCHPMRYNKTGFLSADDISKGYVALRNTLKTMGGNKNLRPEEPFEGADEMLSSLMSLFPPPQPYIPQPLGSATSIDEFFNFVQSEIDWFSNVADTLLNQITDLLKEGSICLGAVDPIVGLSVRALRLLVYGYELALYRMYRSARYVLVMNGICYPFPDELQSDYARPLYTPSQCGVDAIKKNFPKMRKDDQNHLDCPLCRIEEPRDVAGFHVCAPSSLPGQFIRMDAFNSNALKKYALSQSPQDTRALQDQGLRIGNAVDFTVWMITNASHSPEQNSNIVYANWNLDSDRGYGAKCWQGIVPHCRSGLIASLAAMLDEFGSKYKIEVVGEKYINNKDVQDLFINNLTVREEVLPNEVGIPKNFKKLDENLLPKEWEQLLAPRLEPHNSNRLKNVYYVNGMYTSSFDAGFSSAQLAQFLIDRLPANQRGELCVRLVHNRHKAALLEEEISSDLIEAAEDKKWAYTAVSDVSVWSSSPGRINLTQDVMNPTTIAVISLLHQAMVRNAEIILFGFSQGSLITTNGIIAFASLGNVQRAYLKKNVRVVLLGFAVYQTIRDSVRNLLNNKLKEYANPGDPVVTWFGQPPNTPFDLTRLNDERHRLSEYFNLMEHDPEFINFIAS